MFPTGSPYRIDQVVAAPLLMLGLFMAQVFLAALMSAAAAWKLRRLWIGGALVLLVLLCIFFTLASWGTSDTTKLSHYLAFEFNLVKGEPFWMMAAPVVVSLPYRMSAVHGLVAAGFAAAAILLACAWKLPGWAGWWALLITCSPLIRTFMQNGATRQAFATLLLLPVLLRAGALLLVPWRLIVAGILASSTMHTSFLGSLLISLAPLPLRAAIVQMSWIGHCRHSLARFSGRQRLLIMAVGSAMFLTLALVILQMAPVVLNKVHDYIYVDPYFNQYSIASVVTRLQLAMGLGIILSCWRRRLGWKDLVHCGHSRQLLLFFLLYTLIQVSVKWNWIPQITSRFADTVGLAFLIVFLAWLKHYRTAWAVIPALLVTGHYWIFQRIIPSGDLPCGSNDEFLCIPDRWPWQVRY